MKLAHKEQASDLKSPGDYYFQATRGQGVCFMACPICGEFSRIAGTNPETCARCPLNAIPQTQTLPCGHSFTIKDGEAIL